MSRLDTLKKLRESLQAVAKAQQSQKEEIQGEGDAVQMALMLSTMDDITEAIREVRSDNQAVLEALQNITITAPPVEVPEIKLPNIELPTINVPEPRVTVNVPNINVPEAKVTVEVPEIKVPTPEVTVNIPEIKVPDVIMPSSMEVVGEVSINNPRNKPIPTTLVDFEGKPLSFGGGSGGSRSLPRKERVQSAKTNSYIDVTGDSTQVLSINNERHTFTIVNDSADVVYLSYGNPAIINRGLRLNPNGGSHTDDIFVGAVNAISTGTLSRLTVLEL